MTAIEGNFKINANKKKTKNNMIKQQIEMTKR